MFGAGASGSAEVRRFESAALPQRANFKPDYLSAANCCHFEPVAQSFAGDGYMNVAPGPFPCCVSHILACGEPIYYYEVRNTSHRPPKVRSEEWLLVAPGFDINDLGVISPAEPRTQHREFL